MEWVQPDPSQTHGFIPRGIDQRETAQLLKHLADSCPWRFYAFLVWQGQLNVWEAALCCASRLSCRVHSLSLSGWLRHIVLKRLAGELGVERELVGKPEPSALAACLQEN